MTWHACVCGCPCAQVASNGVEAVQAIRAGRQFDVVLMDMMMPVMSGVEATREIRALGHTQLPILAMVRMGRGLRGACRGAYLCVHGSTRMPSCVSCQRLCQCCDQTVQACGCVCALCVCVCVLGARVCHIRLPMLAGQCMHVRAKARAPRGWVRSCSSLCTRKALLTPACPYNQPFIGQRYTHWQLEHMATPLPSSTPQQGGRASCCAGRIHCALTVRCSAAVQHPSAIWPSELLRELSSSL